MFSKPNPIAEQNLIFAGLGLQLGILSKDKVIRAFTEWLFDKSKPLVDILIQQNALSSEEANSLKVAVQAHIKKEGDQEKALASLHVVKDLESDLDHLGDNDLHQTLDSAVHQRKEMGLDEQFARSHQLDQSQISQLFQIQEPEVKDRFERKSFLDAGALGEVYLAHDRELNRRVVTKYIKPENADIKHNQALFLLEGEVTGALEHPGIVPVYGLGKDIKGRFFYAMRYIQGKKLSRVISEYHAILNSNSGKKHEAFIDLLQNFQSACLAIEYAHKKGVLHCDIKPDNIMIGDYGEVFVVDWGLVIIHGEVSRAESRNEDEFKTLDIGEVPPYRPSDAASSGLHWNQGGSRKGIGGTPSYIAPEQLRAHNNDDVSLLGPPSDIYALGGTLFQILTGKPPHQFKRNSNDNMKDFNQRILEGVFPRPTELNSQTPKSLEAISLKALSLDPKNRYASARELADDVKRYLADEPVKAHEESFLEKSQRFGRKNKVLVGVIAALLLCIGIGGIIYGFITKGYNENLQKSELIAKHETKKALKNEDEAVKQKNWAENQFKKAIHSTYVNAIHNSYNEYKLGNLRNSSEALKNVLFNQRNWEHNYLNTKIYSDYAVLGNHQNIVISTAFSSDGKKIASASYDKTIKIWEVNSSINLKTLKGHTAEIQSIKFHPKNEVLVSGGWDGTIKIWDISTGKELKSIETGSEICSISFLPSGSKFYTGHKDGRIKAWSMNTFDELDVFNHSSGYIAVLGLACTSDGNKLLSVGNDGKIISWDLHSKKKIFENFIHSSGIFSVAISSNCKVIATGGEDNLIKLLDLDTGKELRVLKSHLKQVYSVSFSPDGQYLASGSWDKSIKLWKVSSGELLATNNNHESQVNSVCFSLDGKTIVSGASQGNICLWNPFKANIFDFSGHLNEVTDIAINKIGDLIASVCLDKTIKIWDARSGQIIRTLKGHDEPVRVLVFSHDGEKLASGGEDRTVLIWDVKTGKIINKIRRFEGSVLKIEFSSDDKTISIVSDPGNIDLFDSVNCEKIWGKNDSEFSFSHIEISFSLDGSKILVLAKNQIYLYDCAKGELLKKMRKKDKSSPTGTSTEGIIDPIGPIFSKLCFIDANSFFLVESLDEFGFSCEIWNIQTTKVTKTYGFSELKFLCFSLNAKSFFATSEADRNVFFQIELETGKIIKTFNEHKAPVTKAFVARDGDLIVSYSADTTIRVWEVLSASQLIAISVQNEFVKTLNISPDGKKVAITDQFGKLKIYDVDKKAIDLELHSDKSLVENSIFFSLDGKNITGGTSDGELLVWDTTTGKIMDRVNSGFKALKTLFCDDGEKKIIGVNATTGGLELLNLPSRKIIRLEVGNELEGKNELGPGNQIHLDLFYISPDGKKVLGCKTNGEILVWDVLTGDLIGKMVGHTKQISAVSFCDGGLRVATGSFDKLIIIWDLAACKSILKINNHDDRLKDVVFSPDGARIFSLDYSGAIKISDTFYGSLLISFQVEKTIKSLAVSKDGKIVFYGGNGGVFEFDATLPQDITILRSHDDDIEDVSFNLDGSLFASTDRSGFLKIWDTVKYKEIFSFRDKSFPKTLDFSPDGKKIAVGGANNKIRILDSSSGVELANFGSFNDKIDNISKEKSVVDFSKLKSEMSGRGAFVLQENEDFDKYLLSEVIENLSYDLTGNFLLTASRNYQRSWEHPNGTLLANINLWDSNTGINLRNIPGLGKSIFIATFSPDGKYLAEISKQNKILLTNLSNLRIIKEFDCKTESLNRIAFSSDNNFILVLDNENNERYWNIHEQTEIAKDKIPNDLIFVSTFNRDFKRKRGNLRLEFYKHELRILNDNFTKEAEVANRKNVVKLLQPFPIWHKEKATEAELNDNYFSAAFHLRKLIEIEPSNKAAKMRMQVAEYNLKESK